MKSPGGAAGHVEAALWVDPQRNDQAPDAAKLQFGEIGQGAAQVRSSNRRQAQDSARPRRVGQQSASIETTHAVADHVDRLIGKRSQDLLAQPACPVLDTRDRRHSRHQDPVPRGLERLGDTPEIGRRSSRAPRPVA